MKNEIIKLNNQAIQFLAYEGAVDENDFQVYFQEVKTAEPIENFKFISTSSKEEKIFDNVKITVLSNAQFFKGQTRGTFIYINFQNDAQNIILKQY